MTFGVAGEALRAQAMNSIRYSRAAVAMMVSPFLLLAGGCAPAETGLKNTTLPAKDDTAQVLPLQRPAIRLAGRAAVPIDSIGLDQADKQVTIAGRVVQRAALLKGWLYEIQDETGSLWVLSDRSEPQIEAQVTVDGIVRFEPIVVGEIDAGSVYLEEAGSGSQREIP